MNIEKLQSIIEEVNDGNWSEYAPFFNDNFGLFLNIVIKHDLLDMIDPLSDGLVEYQNIIFYTLITNPKLDNDKWFNFICEKIIHNDLVSENGEWYLYLSEQSELSELFSSGGRESTRDVVKGILGEDHWEPYWDTTDDVYRDVVTVLNKENLKVLYERILKEVEGQTIGPETEYLEDLGEGDEIVITKDNFPGMFGDELTLRHIISDYATDTKSELSSLYNQSYNSAYESEVYNDIWGELSQFFEGRSEWRTRPYKFKPEKTQYYLLVKIRNVKEDIKKYLFELQTSYYREDTLEYQASYMDMLKQGMEESVWRYLDFRVPDYPNHTEVDKLVNELFGDYF
jgi:hypothetical protein